MATPTSSTHSKESRRRGILSTSSKAKSAGIEISGALVTTLTILKESLDGVPVLGLKAAVGGVLEVIKAINKTKENAADIEELRSHIEQLTVSIIEPLKKAKITEALQARIDALIIDLERIKADYDKMSAKGQFRQFFAVHDHATTIIGLDRMLHRSLEMFMAGGIIEVERRVEQIHQLVGATDLRVEEIALTQTQYELLNHLPKVNARYDCATRTAAPVCLENTRVALLNEIFDWIDNPRAEEKIYWLHGLAGTGKSTIAHTVAQRLDNARRLGASFFFSRGVEDQRDPLRVLPTIAWQLAEFSSQFKMHLVASLEGRKDAGTSALPVQMEKLLANPLQAMAAISSLPSVIIVMDALDECNDPQLVTTLLKLVTGFILDLPNIQLKIFITSRPEHHITVNFAGKSVNQIARPFVLHNIERSIVQADIEVYLRSELVRVAQEFGCSELPGSWPSSSQILELVARAGALFIVASTGIKFISDPRIRQPKRQLHLLLSDKRASGSSPYKDLDLVYLHVLKASVDGAEDPGDYLCVRFREVVGAILNALDPLPPTTLQLLLGCDLDYITATVDLLRSVIIVPSDPASKSEPLRTFHLSFPNYLTERCSDLRFSINPLLHHSQLALQCLHLLNSFLRRNICNLPDPLALNSEAPDLEDRLIAVVQPHHRYACRYWASHLEAVMHFPLNSSVNRDSDAEFLEKLKDDLLESFGLFGREKLLEWFEVMSLLGWLDLAIPMLKAAEKWLKSIDATHPTLTLLNDGHRFVIRFFKPIQLGASQVYHSALAFMPKSMLYEGYKSALEESVQLVKGRESGWDPCLCVLKEHTAYVMSVGFSHDSSYVASGSLDSTICIWDAVNGSLVNTLKGHTGQVNAVMFSFDSSLIISGSGDSTVHIWDALTGSLIRKLEGHTDRVLEVAFSHDSSHIVSGSADKNIHIWDTVTGSLISILKGHTKCVQSVAFSHDSFYIVSGSDDRTVCIWDAATGSFIKMLTGHTNYVYSVAFSHDSSLVVTGSADCTICIWDAVTGSLIRKLEGRDRHHILGVGFSHDSSHIVSSSADSDRNIHIWDTVTGSLVNTLKGHIDWVRSIAFSHDSSYIVSGSDDRTVCIWDAAIGSSVGVLKGNSHLVNIIAFSPDSLFVVSGCQDNTAYIWDARTGSLLRKLEGHRDQVLGVAFSHDGSHVVSSSADRNIHIWDTMTGSLVNTLKGHTDWVRSIAFSHDSSYLASGSDDKTICIWDAATGSLIKMLTGHTNYVYSVAFSHDSSLVAGSADRNVHIWDTATGSSIWVLKEHMGSVQTVAFSHDGLHVVSGSSDHTVCIWNTATGSLITKLKGHTNTVHNVAFSQDSSYVITYDIHGHCIFWDSDIRTSKNSQNLHPVINGSLPVLSIEGQWVVMKSFKGDLLQLCYLPFLPSSISAFEVHDSVLALGTSLGAMYILDFSKFFSNPS